MTSTSPDALTVYWRPGCPFCSALFSQLDRAGIGYRAVDIWTDPDAAGVVRSIAQGNETVPTVVVGDMAADGIGLVNPDVHEILAAAAEVAPQLVPEGYEPPQPGRMARWIRARLGGED